METFVIEKLDKSHTRQMFCCGVECLNVYLQQYASQESRKNISVTYILKEKLIEKIAGYYTLSASAIELKNLPDNLAKKLPHYPLVPTTLIGRLAVDRQYQKQGLGEILLVDGLKRTYQASQEIASFAVLVDAINDKAMKFYQKFGFITLSSKKNQLYLPMKTIEKLF